MFSSDRQTDRNLHLCLLLLVGSVEVLRDSSLTGSDLTRRTRGAASRARLAGGARGTGGETRPRNSNNLQGGERREERGERREDEVTHRPRDVNRGKNSRHSSPWKPQVVAAVGTAELGIYLSTVFLEVELNSLLSLLYH